MPIRTLKWFVIVLLGCTATAWSGEKKASSTVTPIAELTGHGPVDFAKEVQPILRKNCLACHGHIKPKADLNLESPPSIRKGGESGPAIVAGKGVESLLVKICAGLDENSFMPPAKNNVGAKALTSEQLGILKLWIDQGALGDANAGVEPLVWKPLPAGLNPIVAVDVTADGQTAACTRANQIFLYNLPAGQLTARLADPALNKDGQGNAADRDFVQSLAFSPDGTLLASGGFRCIKLWRKQPFDGKAEFNDPAAKPSPVQSIALHTATHRLAKGFVDGRVEVWDTESRKEIWTLSAHTAAVDALIFSTDGAILLSGSSDKMIRIWNAASGEVVGEIFSSGPVTALAYHDATQQIVSGGGDNFIRVWTLPSHADYESSPIKEFKGHSVAVSALEFANGGKHLLSSSTDGAIIQWNFPDGNQVRKFNQAGRVVAVAVRGDAKRLYSLSGADLKIHNFENGQGIVEVKGDREAIDARNGIERDSAFYKSEMEYHKAALQNSEKDQKTAIEALKKAAEARIAAVKDADVKAEAFKKATDEKDVAQKASAGPADALKKATEYKVAVSKSAADAEAETKVALEKTTVVKKTFDKSGQTRAAAEKALNELQAKAKDAAAKIAPEMIKAAEAQFESAKLVYERDMAMFATAEKAAKESEAKSKIAADAKTAAEKAFNDATAKNAETTTKFKAVEKIFADAESANTAARSVKEVAEHTVERSEALVKKADADLTFHKTSQAEFEHVLKQNEAKMEVAKKTVADSEKPLRAVAVSPSNTFVAVAGEGGLVSFWSAENGRASERFRVPQITAPGAINAIKFLDDKRLVIASTAGFFVWSVNREWKLERTIGSNGDDSPFSGRILALQFSADGKSLAVGGGIPSRSGEVKIVNPANGAVLREFKDAHSDTVFGVAFTADGKLLATCGADRFIRIFDVAGGKLVKTFEGHTHHVLSVSWKRDGRTLASAGADKTIKLWDMVTGEQKLNIENRFKKEATSVHYLWGQNSVLTSSGDGTVRLLKDEGGGDIKSYGGNDRGFIQSAAISADGKIVVTGGDSSVLFGYDGTDGKQLISFEPPK